MHLRSLLAFVLAAGAGRAAPPGLGEPTSPTVDDGTLDRSGWAGSARTRVALEPPPADRQCVTDDECEGTMMCADAHWNPGCGTQMVAQDQCAAHGDCPDGRVCAMTQSGCATAALACVAPCTSDLECPAHMQCAADGVCRTPRCADGCPNAWTCAGGDWCTPLECDDPSCPTSHACRGGLCLPPECATHDECARGICVQGACVEPACNPTEPCSDPAAPHCVAGRCQRVPGQCVPSEPVP